MKHKRTSSSVFVIAMAEKTDLTRGIAFFSSSQRKWRLYGPNRLMQTILSWRWDCTRNYRVHSSPTNRGLLFSPLYSLSILPPRLMNSSVLTFFSSKLPERWSIIDESFGRSGRIRQRFYSDLSLWTWARALDFSIKQEKGGWLTGAKRILQKLREEKTLFVC